MGTRIDVKVGALGDAKFDGTLLATPLLGDGNVYAVAQGAISSVYPPEMLRKNHILLILMVIYNGGIVENEIDLV